MPNLFEVEVWKGTYNYCSKCF